MQGLQEKIGNFIQWLPKGERFTDEAIAITKFSPESRYVLELVLNVARLKQSKQIDTEFILLALIQLTQVGNSSLLDVFESNEIDIEDLSKKIQELNS